jgi:hypothetical protein
MLFGTVAIIEQASWKGLKKCQNDLSDLLNQL